MTPFIIFLVITLVNSEVVVNSTKCDGFQANYNLKDLIGTWHVVAIIPEKQFRDKFFICSQMDISEADGAGLKWLINKTVELQKTPLIEDSTTVVRQRYYTDTSFDVWSKSIDGVSGCFQLVISLDISKNETIADHTLKHDVMMQLHLLEVKGSEPFLLQMLWGQMIAVVIYQRKQGVTENELKPVFEFMNKLRGPQMLPKLCENHFRDIIF